jgi:hypothetical protein
METHVLTALMTYANACAFSHRRRLLNVMQRDPLTATETAYRDSLQRRLGATGDAY